MEDQEERTKRVEKKNIGLIYIIILIFVTLGITSFFLYQNMQEVKTLQAHKRVLMDRLAEEVFAKQKLQKETDSLKKYLDSYQPVPVSADFQKLD